MTGVQSLIIKKKKMLNSKTKKKRPRDQKRIIKNFLSHLSLLIRVPSLSKPTQAPLKNGPRCLQTNQAQMTTNKLNTKFNPCQLILTNPKMRKNPNPPSNHSLNLKHLNGKKAATTIQNMISKRKSKTNQNLDK